MDFPFNTDGRCPACGDAEEDSVLCDACSDMVRNDPRTGKSPSPTTEQLMEAATRTVEKLSPEEKAKLRQDLNRDYGSNPCVDCGQPSSHHTLYICENQREFRCCDVGKFDREFLTACGVAVDVGPARGVVYVKVAMQGEIVRKRRKYVASKRYRPKPRRRYDLGEFAI
jgi:hypothetical protein